MKKSKLIIDSNGDKRWFLNGLLHRVDGPAIECTDGYKYWYLNGKRHREDGPAIECANGNKFWYLNGKLHRIDGPAVEYTDGDKYWFLNGKGVKEEDVIDFNPKITEREYLKFVISL